jgi:hypothetical protein
MTLLWIKQVAMMGPYQEALHRASQSRIVKYASTLTRAVAMRNTTQTTISG